jgi:hypothetical protein
MLMNTAGESEELNRATDELIRMVAILRSKRIQAYSRGHLLRVQTDLAMLVSRIGEVQRIVSVCMIQRGRGEMPRIAQDLELQPPPPTQ